MLKIFCQNSLQLKLVGCFQSGSESLMFDGILNATLSVKKISTKGFLIHIKHKYNNQGELIHLVHKVKKV